MDQGAMMGQRPPPTLIWMVLTLPWGLSSGFVLVTLTFLATRHGLSITEGALLAAALILPWCIQAVWSPVIDLTLSYRRWYLVATCGIALLTFAMAAVPLSRHTLSLFLLMISVAGVFDTAIYVAVPAMVKLTARPEQYGRASAWTQIGHMGGIGLGGSLGLHLTQRLPAPWMSGLVLGAMCLLCCTALPQLPPRTRHQAAGTLAAMRQVPADLWQMLREPAGLLCTLLGSLPFATGCAGPVMSQSAVAAQWGANAGVVALVQGTASCVATSLGCLIGGWLCGYLGPRTAFISAGLLLGAADAAMAGAPADVTVYAGGMIFYAFATGACYASYGPVMLEAMGFGSLSSKVGLLGSLGFFPVWWVGLVMGRVADVAGPRAALMTEAGLAIVSVLAFFAVVRVMRRIMVPAIAGAGSAA